MNMGKRAAGAAPRFQERLKTQITRSTAVLLTAFLLLFGVLLAIYSEGYTYYENREYNRQLTEAFRDIYLSCSGYLRDAENTAVMESFLGGEITPLNMSYQFHRFSYSSQRVSDLLLLDGDGAAAFSTMEELSSHLLYFCQSVIPRLTGQTNVYTTIYYMSASDSRLLFARQLDGLGYAFLLLDGGEWNRSLGRLPYDYVVTDGSGTVMVASNAETVDALNHFVGAGKTRFSSGGQQYMVSAGQSALGGLVVYTLLQKGSWGTYYVIGCLCAVLMFSILFSTLLRVSREIASRSSQSVETLHDELSIIQQGNVDHRIRLETGDEFQEIAAHINSMLGTINQLNQRNMELAQLNNSAEIAQLESRFHPHFLYNTLENIRYAILLGEPEKADEMIRRLTALLRYSTDTSRAMVPLGSDAEKLRDYLEIIRFRQNGQFSYRIELGDGVGEVLIPKLWIQPVVENSVKYGFLRRQTLHVDLTAQMEEGFLRIVVTDNGTGFEPQRLREVQQSLTAPQKDKRQSGLQSIARRLALLYGEESTITVESEYMVYTRVTLRMKTR